MALPRLPPSQHASLRTAITRPTQKHTRWRPHVLQAHQRHHASRITTLELPVRLPAFCAASHSMAESGCPQWCCLCFGCGGVPRLGNSECSLAAPRSGSIPRCCDRVSAVHDVPQPLALTLISLALRRFLVVRHRPHTRRLLSSCRLSDDPTRPAQGEISYTPAATTDEQSPHDRSRIAGPTPIRPSRPHAPKPAFRILRYALRRASEAPVRMCVGAHPRTTSPPHHLTFTHRTLPHLRHRPANLQTCLFGRRADRGDRHGPSVHPTHARPYTRIFAIMTSLHDNETHSNNRPVVHNAALLC